MSHELKVEVVYAGESGQRLVSVSLPAGKSVADAIETSSMAKHFPAEDLDALEVGIWGRVVSRDTLLKDGDRVELYRQLAMEPREARRRLAAAGKTMSDAGKG